MNDEHELESWLRDALRRGSLPGAPANLQHGLEEIPNAAGAKGASRSPSGLARDGPRLGRVLAVAAVLLVGGAVAISVGNRGPTPPPLQSSSPSPAAHSSAEASAAVPIRFTYQPQWTTDTPYSLDSLAEAVSIIQQRIDATGVVGVHVATDDDALIVVDIPRGLDPDPIRRLVGRRGHLEFVPLGSVFVETGSNLDPGSFTPLFDGSYVTDASVVEDPTGQHALLLSLRQPATRLFADYTAAHIGEMFAIVMDGVVVAAPIINAEVPDGAVQISFESSGSPDQEELARLATIIRLGQLPVPIVEIAGGPSPTPSALVAADPPIRCEAPLAVDGPQLDCNAAVRSAMTLLPAYHPAIAEITFNHDCHDVIVQTIPDCAVQLSGTVSITFFDGTSPVRIAVSLGSDPRILPNLPIPDTGETAIALNAAPADLGCDAMGIPYRSLIIHIDPSVADPVWAITDTGSRLRTFWSPGFRGGTNIDPVVYDSHGVVVARDGTRIGVPDAAWPDLAGYFVCASTDAIYVLSMAPG